MGDGANQERDTRLILYGDAHSFEYPHVLLHECHTGRWGKGFIWNERNQKQTPQDFRLEHLHVDSALEVLLHGILVSRSSRVHHK